MRYLSVILLLTISSFAKGQDTCFMQLKDKVIIIEQMPLEFITANDVRYSEVHVISAKNKAGKDAKLLATAPVNEPTMATNEHCSLLEKKGNQVLLLKTFYSSDGGKSFRTMSEFRQKLVAKFNPELNVVYPSIRNNCLELEFTLKRDPGKRDYYTSCDGGKTFKKKIIK